MQKLGGERINIADQCTLFIKKATKFNKLDTKFPGYPSGRGGV